MSTFEFSQLASYVQEEMFFFLLSSIFSEWELFDSMFHLQFRTLSLGLPSVVQHYKVVFIYFFALSHPLVYFVILSSETKKPNNLLAQRAD